MLKVSLDKCQCDQCVIIIRSNGDTNGQYEYMIQNNTLLKVIYGKVRSKTMRNVGDSRIAFVLFCYGI